MDHGKMLDTTIETPGPSQYHQVDCLPSSTDVMLYRYIWVHPKASFPINNLYIHMTTIYIVPKE
jgi:hypothetical protein